MITRPPGSDFSHVLPTRPPILVLALLLALAPPIASGDDAGTGFAYGFELSTTEFDEEVFAGSVAGLSGYIAWIFRPHYQLGLRFHDSIFFTPSLDRGEEFSSEDDLLDVSARVLYLQRDWPIAEGLRLHAMVGYSRVEIEDEEFVCPVFFCLFGATLETTYRERELGLAYGFGGSWEIGDAVDLSLTWIDYSDSDFDYRTAHLGVNFRVYR